MRYSTTVQRYFHDARRVGTLNTALPHTGKGVAGTARNGDVVEITLQLAPASTTKDAIIQHAKFKVYGGVATVAAASWVTAWLEQRSIISARTLHEDQVISALGLSTLKRHSALLVRDAVRAAIDAATC